MRVHDYLAVHPDPKVQKSADAMVLRVSQRARELLAQLRM
jgi:hypothetical protein